MANDFTLRRPRAQSLRECLLRDDDGRDLMSAFDMAKRAGAVIAPVLKRFHFSVDFTDPAHCRIEGQTLILLVPSADQENRLRQLLPRTRAALATAGLPITDVDVHLIPKQTIGEEPLLLARCDTRPASATGAAAIDRTLDEIADPELRETLTRLRDVLAPEHGADTSLVENRLAEESLDLAERRRMLTIKESDLRYGLEAAYIPTAEEAAELPPLAAVRERRLSEIAEQQHELDSVIGDIARIDRRLETINEALTVLPDNPVRAEAIAARDREPETQSATAPRRTPPVSAAAHAALSRLIRETASPTLRSTFTRLCDTLSPEEDHFAEALGKDIRREMSRLSQLGISERTEAQKKRLDQLTEALLTLKNSPESAGRLADRLYGSIL